MHFEYRTRGTCASKVIFNIENNIVTDVRFIGGCSGNTQGVSALVEGMTVDEVISKLQGIRCGMKSTSCPDQLAQALIAAKDQSENA